MIIEAGAKIGFSGPQRVARSEELLRQLPAGAAQLQSDGVVKLLRAVRITYTPVSGLPEITPFPKA